MLGRQIDQAGLRIERHRVPIVGTEDSRDAVTWFVGLTCLGYLDRPTVRVITGRPINIHEILGGNELAVRAVDDEKETVLRRVQNDLALLAADLQIGEDN